MIDETDIVYRLRKRAEIRRQIPGRKAVQEGKPDRMADLLDEAADEIARLRGETIPIKIAYFRNTIGQVVSEKQIGADAAARDWWQERRLSDDEVEALRVLRLLPL